MRQPRSRSRLVRNSSSSLLLAAQQRSEEEAEEHGRVQGDAHRFAMLACSAYVAITAGLVAYDVVCHRHKWGSGGMPQFNAILIIRFGGMVLPLLVLRQILRALTPWTAVRGSQ